MEYGYIAEKPILENHAGNKARTDIDKIFASRYDEPLVNIVNREGVIDRLFLEGIKRFYNCRKISNAKNKTYVFQYPCYIKCYRRALEKLVKNNRTIVIIHDLDFLRSMSKETIKDCINELNTYTVLIVHNNKMREKLEELGVTSAMVTLTLFDYLLEDPPKTNREKSKTVAFAGNLAKSEFLKMHEIAQLKLRINLYGPNYDSSLIKSSNILFKGSYTPEVIPFQLEGSFGLIWDGKSIDTCSGSFGEYMKYNNPQKLSLYIAAGLPIICWNQSAISEFVKEHNIGFSVASLNDISDYIDNINFEMYQNYVDNIVKLQRKVIKGNYTSQALKAAEHYILQFDN